MQICKRVSLITLVAMSFLLALPANAWNPTSSIRHLLRPRLARREAGFPVEASSLAYRSGAEAFEMIATPVTFPLSSEQKVVNLPKKWDLPRHSPSVQEVMRTKFLWDAELVMGRAAMIAALTLMIGELSTGHSIAHQIMTFVGAIQ